jgi:hypothetical protein
MENRGEALLHIGEIEFFSLLLNEFFNSKKGLALSASSLACVIGTSSAAFFRDGWSRGPARKGK